MKNHLDYSSLFYLSPLPSWVYNIETFQILDVNQAAIDHYGYSKEEFLKLSIKDLRPKGEISKMLAAHNAIDQREGNIFFGVFTHQKKNGERMRMEINGHKVEYLNKTCMMAVCQDVTYKEEQYEQLKASEKALRESETRFRTIFEIASLGIAQVDPTNGQIILVNSYYETITGYKTQELLKMTFVELTHPDDRAQDWEVFQKAMLGELEYRNVKRYIKKDGSIVWVKVHLAFIRNENGKPTRTVAICEDITKQKEEEQRLKLLESVITNTNDAILITEAEPFDEPGPKIIYVNEAFTKMTGYKAEEVIGKTPRILQGPNSDPAELARLSKAIRNWESCEITTINYKKNGEEFWINFSVSPVADEKGWYTHWIAVERDVTDQKLKEIEKELLGKISANFAFENNLINSANELCKTLSEFGKFDFVELWLPNIENTKVQLSAYAATTTNANIFYECSKNIKSFKLAEGLPGVVWLKNASLLWGDISKKDDFVRKEAAEKAGVDTAMGIPLKFNKTIVGVLVVGTQHEVEYLKKYLKIFEQLKQFLGSEINRKKLENDLNHLYEAIPDILCLADSKGRFLKINKAGCELLGYSEQEILSHSFDEFLHPDDKDKSINELMKLGEGQTTFKFENRFVTKSGSIIWLNWTCSNSAIEDGLIYSTAKDITEEKNLLELNRLASRMARIGSWEIDVVKNTLFWSNMVHELHETNPKTFVPNLDTAINFYPEDQRIMVREAVDNCIKTGKPFDYECIIITANNNERWIRSIGNAEIVDGRCLRVYGSFQDIHDRKAFEMRLQSLANNLPGVVFQYLVNPNGSDELRYVSKGAEQIWGFSPQVVVENNNLVWNQIKSGGDFSEVQQSIQESIKSKSKWTARWKYVMPSGELKTHLAYGSPYFLPDGTVLFNSVILDITQEAKNEALLEQATDMAKIGGWEMNLINQENDAMFWSPMTREILEVDEHYNPSLTGGIEFYSEESKTLAKLSVENLIKTGIEFDQELLITSAKGNEKWIRCIGKSDWVGAKCVKIYGSFQDIHQQKTNEIALLKNLKTLEDYKFSLDQSAITAITDARGVITYVNDNFCEISQYSNEEIIGKTHQLINSKHHSKAFFVDLWKTISLGKVWRGEIKNKAKDGSYYWVDTTIVPFLDEKNKPFQYMAIRFDVTARKFADELVIETLEEKNNILERIGDAFFALDKDFKVTYWNKRAEEIIGVKREELVGFNLWEKFPAAKELNFFKQYQKAFKTQTTVNFEEYFEPFNQWYEANGYPSPEGISVFFRDITDKKLAKEKILLANERFERATEATNDAIWDFDLRNNQLFWGKGFYTLFGYNPDEIQPSFELLISLIHKEDRERIAEQVQQYMADPNLNSWYEEYRFLKADGSFSFVNDRATFLRNSQGEVVRVIGAMNDITERKNFEKQLLKLNTSLKRHAQELEMTNKELEQFAFIASHDLQEPLRMVSSFMDQLKRKYENQLDEKAIEYIHYATDGAKRMKRIILDLLEYSRAGKFTEAREIIDVNKLVENYRILRRKIIQEKGVDISIDKLPLVESYKAPLTQTLHCLLDNAINYSKKGQAPKIKISLKSRTDCWEIEIADKGIGIDPQFHNKIFVIFQRLHNKEQYEGTGIGLSIVKKHVENWGGKIWLDSKPDKGSKFYFTIPKTTTPKSIN